MSRVHLSWVHLILLALGVALTTVLAVHPELALAVVKPKPTAGVPAGGSPAAAGQKIETMLQGIVGPVFMGFMGVKGVGHFLAHDTPKALGHFGLAAVTAVPIYASGPLQHGLSGIAGTLGGAF